MTTPGDEELMRFALLEAQTAAEAGETPVGALLIKQGKIIGKGYNRTLGEQLQTSHAELVAMREASARLGLHALTGATLCVTLEPCLMCLGALVQARIARVVFGAYEPQTGALVSRYQLADYPGHRFDWRGGVLREECAALMQAFFRRRRADGAAE